MHASRSTFASSRTRLSVHSTLAHLACVIPAILIFSISGCGDTGDQGSGASSTDSGTVKAADSSIYRSDEELVPEEDGAYHVRPGQQIQHALEAAAEDPDHKRVVVHAGTYRPQFAGQAMIWFNARHDGITLETSGDVLLTAVNPDVALEEKASFPGAVNHVVYFGDGISGETIFRGFKITGAKGLVTESDEPYNIEPESDDPNLKRAMFYYTDGGAIKIFGRSYPTIENIEAFDNFATPCGAGISVEHRGFNDKFVVIRNCIFRNNQCPVTGAAIDLLNVSPVRCDHVSF